MPAAALPTPRAASCRGRDPAEPRLRSG